MIKAKEDKIIAMANQSGIPVKRVTKPSRNPAIIKNGILLMTIFSPDFTPCVKD